MVADWNVTYTTSLYFHWFLQGKKRHCLFACSCDLARVCMRFSPLSRSHAHAIFNSRVHATPRPTQDIPVKFCKNHRPLLHSVAHVWSTFWVVVIGGECPLSAVLQLLQFCIDALPLLLFIVKPDFHCLVDAKEAIPCPKPIRQPLIHLGLKPQPQQSATCATNYKWYSIWKGLKRWGETWRTNQKATRSLGELGELVPHS